jgi:hypothetical protein
MVRSRPKVTAYVGVAASALAVALVVGSPWQGSALAGALVLACVPVGSAVMCWVDGGNAYVQAGLTLVLSLAAFALASSLMIWADAWHPFALLALAGVSAASCLARLAHERRR